jgi:hypothetical protein
VRLRLVLQDGKQPGSTVSSPPEHVGPVSVRHQSRKHMGLYDELIRDELPDPPVQLTPRKDKRFESPETCGRCQCKEADKLFLVENGTGLFVCDACSTPPPSKDDRSSAQRI